MMRPVAIYRRADKDDFADGSMTVRWECCIEYNRIITGSDENENLDKW